MPETIFQFFSINFTQTSKKKWAELCFYRPCASFACVLSDIIHCSINSLSFWEKYTLKMNILEVSMGNECPIEFVYGNKNKELRIVEMCSIELIHTTYRDGLVCKIKVQNWSWSWFELKMKWKWKYNPPIFVSFLNVVRLVIRYFLNCVIYYSCDCGWYRTRSATNSLIIKEIVLKLVF